MELLAYVVISFVLSLIASELLRPDPPSTDPLKEPGANNAHVRGTVLPILLGYNKVTPVIGYVGNRIAWNKKVGEIDGGLFHSDKAITQVNYRESGIHFLCVGPAYRLSKITEKGNTIFDQEITRTSHPSGSEFTCTDEGESVFRIYWGEDGQAVDTDLAAITGVATRYPFTCYIYWVKKELGTQAAWSTIEYYLECTALGAESDYIEIGGPSGNISVTRALHYVAVNRYFRTVYDPYFITTDTNILNYPAGSTFVIGSYATRVSSISDIGGGDYRIDLRDFPPTSLTGTYSATLRDTSQDRLGVNPASAFDQLLFEEYPHGLGMDTALFSLSDLTSIKSTFAEAGSEPSPCTLYNKSGSPISAPMSYLLRDYGIFVYQDSSSGQYRFKLIRAGETPTEIAADYFNETDAEQNVAHSTLAPDKIMYSFVEASRSFQSSTILITDDGNAKLSGDPNTKKQTINTATDIESASNIASRLDQGLNTKEGIRLKVSSDLISKEVGDLITLEGVGGVYRLASKKANPGDSEMELAVTQDIYAVENNYTLFTSSGTYVPLALQPDAVIIATESNRFINPDTHGYYLIRARGAGHIPFAGLYRSVDDTTYNSVAALNYQTACEISEEILEDTGGILDTLEVTSLGPDFDEFWEFVDLSDTEWRAGAVCMLIESEYLFPKSVTDLGGGSYRLNDIVRGRFGTAMTDHPSGEVGVLFYLNQIPLIEDSTLLAGDSLYLKTRPYSSVEVMSLDDQEAITLDYTGGGYRPLQPENLNTTNDAYAWISGADAVLRWDYKNAIATTGAGFSLSDEPAELALPEGYFKVTILNGTTVVREELEILTNTFTYTQAMMTTDFGGEPSAFNVQVVEILNGLTSDVEAATITRV